MGDVKWIKLSVDTFNNRKIRQIEFMPEGTSVLLVWVKLLCLAGQCNDNGRIYLTKEIPYTEEMLSQQFNTPLTTIRLALSVFQQFEMIDIDSDVIHISNWDVYQNTEGLEKIREQNRLRKRKQREREKQALLMSRDISRDVTQQNKNKKEDIDKESHHTQGKVPCGSLGNVYLTPEQNDELYKLIPSQADGYIERFGRYKSMKAIESHDDYAWIRGWMDEDEAIVKERRKQEAERWDAIVEEEANASPITPTRSF